MSSVLRKQIRQTESNTNFQRLDAIKQLASSIHAMKQDIENLRLNQPQPHNCEVYKSDLNEITDQIEGLENAIDVLRDETIHMKEEIYENLENVIVEKVISETPRLGLNNNMDEFHIKLNDIIKRLEQVEEQQKKFKGSRLVLTREGLKEQKENEKPVVSKLNL